jgi:hypothetical protein
VTSDVWANELRVLDEISRDDETRELCLQLAALSREGRLDEFVGELADQPAVDEQTKAVVTELAGRPEILHAVDDYVRATTLAH